MSIFLWPFSFLLLFLPFAVRLLLPSQENQQYTMALRVPFFERVKSYAVKESSRTVSKGRFFLILAWVCFVIAAARPVWYSEPTSVPQKARNIVLALDVSDSMKEQDFDIKGKPVTRLAMVKAVVDDFLKNRLQDNIGLVLFASEAYTYAPLSFDNKTLRQMLKEVGFGIAGQMTAIGDGLAMSVQNAVKVPAESRIVILLSDGYANAGSISVAEAVKLAQKQNVKVYTIGVGSEPQFVQDLFGTSLINPASDLDERMLMEIAQQTGGNYFRAKSTEDLKQIYILIDQLEKTPQNTLSIRPRKELFYFPLLAGMFFLLIAWLKWRHT